ncbi:MAG: hypothetical protein J7480_06985 [Microbacteriaceae bacterium]|nr:hypothetical protein [Microbacteriaceae bacterium]
MSILEAPARIAFEDLEDTAAMESPAQPAPIAPPAPTTTAAPMRQPGYMHEGYFYSD